MKESTIEILGQYDPMQLGRYFLRPLAYGIAQDYTRSSLPDEGAIPFAIRLLDSQVVNDKNAFLFDEGTRTFEAIRAACEQAHRFRMYSSGFLIVGSGDLARHICRQVVHRGGFMGEVVRDAMRDNFGPYCNNQVSAFWDHLGVKLGSDGLTPEPWR